jgi:hypothetical protein
VWTNCTGYVCYNITKLQHHSLTSNMDNNTQVQHSRIHSERPTGGIITFMITSKRLYFVLSTWREKF